MKNLLSPSGLKALQQRIGEGRILFAFDFDGTLAPIVPIPGGARMPSGTRSLILRLARSKRVAIVSGRGVADLKTRVPKETSLLIGNHGLERPGAGSEAKRTARKISRDWLRQLDARQPLLEKGGIRVEDKRFSLSLHYRGCPSSRAARAAIRRICGELTPSPRCIGGKEVVNVVPSDSPHKGMALLELMKRTRSKAAFYIGDDVTDEDVFALHDSRILTVRVGKSRSSAAEFYIETQSAIDKLLSILTDFQRSPKNRIGTCINVKARGKPPRKVQLPLLKNVKTI